MWQMLYLDSGKLFMSLTKCSKPFNILVNEFQSKGDVIDAVCNLPSLVPLMSGFKLPKFRG